MPHLIGVALSHRVATLHEMSTAYSVQDVYDLLEVAVVDAHNAALIRAYRDKE